MHRIWGFVFAVVAIVIQTADLRVDAAFGLDSALIQASKVDPLGINDTFASLKPVLKKFLSQPLNDVDHKLEGLLSLQSTTLVTVKLVGFSSDERHQLEVQFSRYLEVINKNEHVHVIGTGGTNNHKLNVKSKIEVDVVRAGGSLSEAIFKAIQNHIEQPSSLSSIYHQPVPYHVVDDIIQGDLEKPLTSYVIYILNLKHQARKYGYDYKKKGGGESDTLHAFSKCLGNFWMGRERYIWIDLAAGPIEYGPAVSGEGLVVKGDIYPSAAAIHGGTSTQKALLADLASVVWSASQMLLAPALRIPVFYEAETEVRFYHIRSPDLEEDKGISWDAIETTFLKESSDGLLLRGQSLSFKRFKIELSECAACSAVLARSTKTYTSRVLLDQYSLFVNEYIDSKQLHYLLSQVQDELMQLGGATNPQGLVRVVPVYIFDLDVERTLLLDRNDQAVAFRDMVIALRTKGFQTMTEFNCNSRPVVAQTREIERPVVAALLQSLWGVTPTHLTWSSEHNSTFLDYTWSLGQTPFGPFSDLFSLSFVQRDAAPRNLLYTMLNTTIWGAVDVLQALKNVGGERKVLLQGARAKFTQRWNLFMYKLNKATSAMSHFDFNSALFFVKSSDHDLYAMHDLVYQASSQMEASINCFKDPPFPWHWVFFIVATPAVFLGLWFRREQLFTNKRKRF